MLKENYGYLSRQHAFESNPPQIYFTNINLEDFSSIKSYWNCLKVIVCQITNVHYPLNNIYLVLKMIFGLIESYIRFIIYYNNMITYHNLKWKNLTRTRRVNHDPTSWTWIWQLLISDDSTCKIEKLWWKYGSSCISLKQTPSPIKQ